MYLYTNCNVIGNISKTNEAQSDYYKSIERRKVIQTINQQNARNTEDEEYRTSLAHSYGSRLLFYTVILILVLLILSTISYFSEFNVLSHILRRR